MGQQRRKVNIVFFYIYALFGIILLYLLFFNLGLDIERVDTSNETQLFVANRSMHLIRDIQVTNEDGSIIQSIPRLLPGEKQKLNLASVSSNRILVTAPFHGSAPVELVGASAAQIASAGGSIQRPEVTYTTAYPQPVYVNDVFTVDLSLCNSSASLDSGKITVSAPTNYFTVQTPQAQLALKAEECKQYSFDFTPIKPGLTSIIFKLEFLNISQDIPIEIEIQE